MIFKHVWRFAICAALLVCAVLPANSQTGTGTIRGTIYDAARASVPSVKLVLTSLATNAVR